MTALEKYSRLQGPGVWKASSEAQRRDVAVSLGDLSLILSDTRSGQPLSHWSLPAVQRLNRGQRPALFAPGTEAEGETLELDDDLLIEALETIRAALLPRPPRPWGRLAFLAGAAVLAVAAVLWLPDTLYQRTAAIVPEAARAQIGSEALDTLTLSLAAERICADAEGRLSLAALRSRVLGDGWRVAVVAGVPGFLSAHLPGQVIVLGDDLLTRLDGAEALAGWMLAEAQAAASTDPLIDALRHAGLRATFTLLTTGALPPHALDGYAHRRFAQPAAWPQPEALGAALDALGVSPTAYALSLPAERADLAQALADRPTSPARNVDRLLSDGAWLTVQAICAP